MISIETDIKQKMAGLQRAMREASDGKILKRELAKELRGLMNPLVSQMRRRVMALPSKGHDGPSMRAAIARQVKAATRFSGKSAGVSIVQKSRSMPRDFRMAGRAFNREQGWHPTGLGGITHVQQIRPAQWFDSQTIGVRPEAQRKVLKALERSAAILAERAKH